jgi:hypothetical protein
MTPPLAATATGLQAAPTAISGTPGSRQLAARDTALTGYG